MNKSILWKLALLIVILVSCKKEASINSPAANTPVVANTQNAFSFNVAANSYTATCEYTLSFSTDSLACSLTVAGQTTGSGSLRIADSNYSTVYADSMLRNQVVAFTQTGKGVPKHIEMLFNGYTGTISFALSRDNLSR